MGMRTIILVVLFLFLVTIVLPVFITQGCDMFKGPQRGYLDEKPYEASVYLHRERVIRNMDLEEYIKGVVAAEMPASFHHEALKAQAVAARTYTVKRMTSLGGSPNPDHPEVDVCTDSTHCQAWISDEEFRQHLRKQFGIFGYKKYLENVYNAVEDTRDLILVYQDEIIDPLFHSTSGGFTENSEQVFSSMVPYLRSVSSPYEDHSPKLTTRVEMKADDFVRTLQQKFDGLKIDKNDIPSAIQVLETSQGGKIISVRIGNKILSGREVRAALGLNSTDFKIGCEGDTVVITTTGYGHGVGMSQYGADGMARRGDTYDRILKHYYTGVDIKRIGELYIPH
jgi:stage II sporulation protein D